MALRRTTLVAGLLLVAGCTVDQSPGLQPTDDGTPLASYSTEGLSVGRSDFCGEINDGAIERALGGPSIDSANFGTGEPVEVSPGVTDIGHEFNCTFEAADGAVARAWVFAPPVTRDQADRLVRRSLKQPGCTPIPGAPAFGDPSVATSCGAEGRATIAFRGLFVDSWLSCSLTRSGSPDEELTDQAGRWCVAVAQAANGQST